MSYHKTLSYLKTPVFSGKHVINSVLGVAGVSIALALGVTPSSTLKELGDLGLVLFGLLPYFLNKPEKKMMADDRWLRIARKEMAEQRISGESLERVFERIDDRFRAQQNPWRDPK